MRGFGTRPRGHGDGVATLQYRAVVGEARRVAPQGYPLEVRGVPSWRGGCLGFNGASPCAVFPSIAEFGGVRPVYGVFQAARASRAASATPRMSCLSHFRRVCAIRGQCRRNPIVAAIAKDGHSHPATLPPLWALSNRRFPQGTRCRRVCERRVSARPPPFSRRSLLRATATSGANRSTATSTGANGLPLLPLPLQSPHPSHRKDESQRTPSTSASTSTTTSRQLPDYAPLTALRRSGPAPPTTPSRARGERTEKRSVSPSAPWLSLAFRPERPTHSACLWWWQDSCR